MHSFITISTSYTYNSTMYSVHRTKPLPRTETMISVSLFCLLSLVPVCRSQVIKTATIEVPTTSNDDTVYLSETLSIDVNVTLDSATPFDTLDILVSWSNNLQILYKQNNNLDVTSGSNININGNQTQQIFDTNFRLTTESIAFVDNSVTDPSSNQISFSLYVYVEDRMLGYGDALSISGVVSYILDNPAKDSVSVDILTSLEYGGPEVETLFEANRYAASDLDEQSVTVDREVEVSVDIEMPGLWSMDGIVVHFDLQSTDISSIPVDYVQFLVTTDNSNVTFSNISNTNVTDFTQSDQVVTSVMTPPAVADIEWSIGDISNTGSTKAYISIKIRFILSQSVEIIDGITLDSTLYMEMNGVSVNIKDYHLIFREPSLSITKTVSVLNKYKEVNDIKIQKVRFTTEVEHDGASQAEAYTVFIIDAINDLKVEYFSPAIRPAFGSSGLSNTKTEIDLVQDVLAVGDTMELSYEASLHEATAELKLETPFSFEASLSWVSMSSSEMTSQYPGHSYGPITSDVCFTQLSTYEEDLVLNHGLAALFFFAFLLLGFLIIIIIFLVWVKCCRRAPYAVVNPTRTTRAAKATGLIVEPRSGKQSVLTSIMDSSMVGIDDSVILVLALKDKTKKYMEFNNLDVWATIQMDIDLEKQRLDAMEACVVILIHEWVTKAVITADRESKTTKIFVRNVKNMLKRLEDEYRVECRELVKRLSTQNQVKLEQLRNKQKSQYTNTENSIQSNDNQDQKEIMDLTVQQHQSEMAELTKLLKLQQDEKLENTRKEYAIKKRMAMKGLQSSTLDEVILQGSLDEDQARSLLREHKSNMATLEKLMDDEVSRQRMMLQEKLMTRKAMAIANETQDEEQRNLLNMLASQTLSPLQELQRDDQLTEEQAKEYLERVKKEMIAAKAKSDAERSQQEANLHKKLSELKKKRLEEKTKEHTQQLEKFEKGFKATQDKEEIGADDFMTAKFALLSRFREELQETEMAVDEETAKELETLQDQLVENTKQQIDKTKVSIYKELEDKGLTEEMKQEILEQHERDVERLMEERDEQRQKQERQLKKKLAKRRKEWAQQKVEEREEQEHLREHEERMVDKLLASQMAMSEDDRKRIMDEHEKQMVAMENSLALGKLRSRRLLEEKLAARKARQLQKLEQEHQEEAMRQMRKAQLESDEEEAAQEAQQELIKKQVQEKLTLLNSDENDQLEEQQEQVHKEMVKERAKSLKAQEEKIGALMAKLQLEKAREIATIEEQQKALWKLKLEMLDDMTEKGAIKNVQCRKLVETHAKEAKIIEAKMHEQKQKQEKELQKRLKLKMADREKSFIARQEMELEELADKETNSVAARLKRVALKHKHMVQMEEFRHKMDIELSQTIEELRRQFEVSRLKQMQDQELQFLAALIKHGQFDPVELRKVLQLLFPAKTPDQIQEMMAKLYDREKWDSEEESQTNQDNGSKVKQKKKKQQDKNMSSLEDKVRAVIMGETLPMNQTPKSSPTPKKPKKKLGKLAPLKSIETPNSDPFGGPKLSGPVKLPSIQHRPEPLGCTDDEEEEIDRRARYDVDSDADDDEDEEDNRRRRPSKKKMDYMY